MSTPAQVRQRPVVAFVVILVVLRVGAVVALSGLARKFVGGRDHAARVRGWVASWASIRCSRSLRSARVNFQLNGLAMAL